MSLLHRPYLIVSLFWIVVRRRLVLVLVARVELGVGEAHGEGVGRVVEGGGSAARGLERGDEAVLILAEAVDAAAPVEDDEEKRLPVARLELADERGDAAVGVPERAGLRDDAAARGRVAVTLLERAGIDARDRQDVRRLQPVPRQLLAQRLGAYPLRNATRRT